MLLELKDYQVSYNKIDYFKYPSITVKEGSSLAILGKSGCGKSTLLNSLFYPFFQGDISYNKAEFMGKDLFKIDNYNLSGITYMPQFSQNGFNPFLSIEKQIKLISKEKNFNIKSMEKDLNKLSLSIDILEKYPYELSGGMKQRLALFLAMINNPKLLIMDEPSSAIDALTLFKIIKYIEEKKHQGTSILLVTHDRNFAKAISDRIIVL